MQINRTRVLTCQYLCVFVHPIDTEILQIYRDLFHLLNIITNKYFTYVHTLYLFVHFQVSHKRTNIRGLLITISTPHDFKNCQTYRQRMHTYCCLLFSLVDFSRMERWLGQQKSARSVDSSSISQQDSGARIKRFFQDPECKVKRSEEEI